MLSGYKTFGSVPVELTPQEILEDLVPAPEFDDATFQTYVPDPNHPSQQFALDKCKDLAKELSKGKRKVLPGVYLDGGFGVGKTHLLVSVYKAFKGAKLFGSFLGITSAIGAIGFAQAVNMFSKYDLICIDEFELDDPGNTMIMSRLLNELNQQGTLFAVTSNTPPNALGEGRFAAADFKREILGLGEKFEIIRVDGDDYRHRGFDQEHRIFTEPELSLWLQSDQNSSYQIGFDELLKLLSDMHPSKFSKLLTGPTKVAIVGAHPITNEFDALRFVAFVDRSYEKQVSLRATGCALPDVFSDAMLEGGYRKKYLRAISRLGVLAS